MLYSKCLTAWSHLNSTKFCVIMKMINVIIRENRKAEFNFSQILNVTCYTLFLRFIRYTRAWHERCRTRDWEDKESETFFQNKAQLKESLSFSIKITNKWPRAFHQGLDVSGLVYFEWRHHVTIIYACGASKQYCLCILATMFWRECDFYFSLLNKA